MPTTPTRVAIVSSYVPRQCGIATFSNDLATNLARHVHGSNLEDADGHISVAAVNDRDHEYQYGPQVTFEIRQHQRSDYHNAADFLNSSHSEVVNLQHEYGLFGGADGAYIIELLERLKKPAVSTFHTVLSQPTEGQRRVLARIGALSHKVVVLADRAKMLLEEQYGIPGEHIVRIHHGTPDVPFDDPERFKDRFMVKGRPVILTFGLLGPSKGIETMLQALAEVAAVHPNVAYMILGATHPVIKRESGESYRLGLERQALDLGIDRNVLFHNHYVTLPVLVDFLQAADLYVTPYRSKEQIVSGTLAFAVASGKAIVSTPYWYAQEMLADGRGRIVDFDDVSGMAEALIELLSNETLRRGIQKKAYDFGRQMIWPVVAKEYDEVFRRSVKSFTRRARVAVAAPESTLSLSLPEVRLDHLYRLSDDTGILQHARYATPNRHHGYCTDDNSRALLVATMSYWLLNDTHILPYLEHYLSFCCYAWNEQRRRFRNFMSYDRRWLDEDGTQDCLARAVWALGYLTAHPPAEQDVSLAGEIFHQAVESTREIHQPRSQALSIIGFTYYLRRFAGSEPVRGVMASMAESLFARFQKHASSEWVWFEDRLTYNNARLPQAMVLAGNTLAEPRYVECGLNALTWLLQSCTTPSGALSVVGNDGWWPRGGAKAEFDQQPIDAAAFVGACKSAYKVTGEKQWLAHMRRCFEWFLGRNVAGESVVDFKTRGCCDGIGRGGVNRNQGAESTLSWLLSLLIMYEMHPGKPAAERAPLVEAGSPG